MRPSRDSDIGPDEDPLVGDGGSADELGWEAPTRPDRPLKLTRPQPAPREPAVEQPDDE